jgi:hypothetical protein
MKCRRFVQLQWLYLECSSRLAKKLSRELEGKAQAIEIIPISLRLRCEDKVLIRFVLVVTEPFRNLFYCKTRYYYFETRLPFTESGFANNVTELGDTSLLGNFRYPPGELWFQKLQESDHDMEPFHLLIMGVLVRLDAISGLIQVKNRGTKTIVGVWYVWSSNCWDFALTHRQAPDLSKIFRINLSPMMYFVLSRIHHSCRRWFAIWWRMKSVAALSIRSSQNSILTLNFSLVTRLEVLFLQFWSQSVRPVMRARKMTSARQRDLAIHASVVVSV